MMYHDSLHMASYELLDTGSQWEKTRWWVCLHVLSLDAQHTVRKQLYYFDHEIVSENLLKLISNFILSSMSTRVVCDRDSWSTCMRFKSTWKIIMLANMSLGIHKLLSHPSQCLFQSQQRSSTRTKCHCLSVETYSTLKINGTNCIQKPGPIQKEEPGFEHKHPTYP